MSESDFDFLLQLVSDRIAKVDTNMRESIKPRERLALTLRFLATGDSYHSLMYLFRIPVCTVSKIIPECCEALNYVLKKDFFKVPTTEREWKAHAKQFNERWNFPHCIGALDGKHVVIQAPAGSGSSYYNYKGTNSIVLMALADANYRITYANIGANGRISDGGVFNDCELSTALQENTLNLPPPESLPGRTKEVPYVVVADDAFALKPYLMKPYPFRNQPGVNRIYNYRISRARRIIENVFGIIATRFRILRKPIPLAPEKFYALLERSEIANFSLMTKQVTIFAPTNEAFQNNKKTIDNEESLVLYHMINLAKTVNQFDHSDSCLTSELTGNPPLWITLKHGAYHDDYYINNARILLNQSNFKAKNARRTEEQVLHKIDEVLIPVSSPKSATNPLFNPNAWDFIHKFDSFNYKANRMRIFQQRIEQLKKQHIFTNDGPHTFFIPIDEGFKDSKQESIDGRVIDGHVIPKRVLFTSPTEKDFMFATLAEGDNAKVFVTFSQDPESKSKTIYIKSHTIFGEGNITKGVVMAAIKEANIPVKNGVVHLIHKPLIIVDHSVKQFLEEKEDGPLSRFYQEIVDSGDVGNEFMQTIQRARAVTLFAPRNAAWDDGNLKNLLRDKQKFRDLLNMHLVVDEKLYVDKIKENNVKQVYQAATLNNKKNLYFNVAVINNNRTLTVEGGGVNATAVQPDIAATNGVIHIIDRVLGVPYTTVLDKLRSDPMLNETYHLGANCGFNHRLNDTTKKYTFFVPRDRAWQQARMMMPSAIKKLFMLDYCYFAIQVLEKHLIVGDTILTMEKIKALANDTSIIYGKESYINKKEVELNTVRDSLKIAVEEKANSSEKNAISAFTIHWKHRKIQVFRPNVECTNGVIHVINYPFLEEDDIRVSTSSPLSLTPHLLMLTLAKWLLL